jgi:hypothetical protein
MAAIMAAAIATAAAGADAIADISRGGLAPPTPGPVALQRPALFLRAGI